AGRRRQPRRHRGGGTRLGRRGPPARAGARARRSRIILLAGFEPFGEYTSNPAGDVAKALDGRAFGAEVVRSAVLPVHHADAASMVSRLVDETAPRAIVHLGLAGARARIALERVAVNVMDFEIADNAGYRATGEPCVAGGPVAYFSTLPLGAILDVRRAPGDPDRRAQRPQIGAAGRAGGEVQRDPRDVERTQLAIEEGRHPRDRLAARQHHRRVSISDSKNPRSGGSVANSAWNASRSMASTLVAHTARTVAERGRSLTSAISPKHSPGPSRRSDVAWPAASSLSTSTSPSLTT